MEKSKRISDEVVRKIVRPREAHLHKGDCGRVLIGAGSVGMAGAAILAARAALRAGSGLVRAAIPGELTTILQIAVPEATCVDRTQLLADAETGALADYNAICIGPGLGESAESIAFVKAMLTSYGGVLVVDADALNIISHNDMLGLLRDRAEHWPDTTVITPHIGEARRLLAAAVQASDKKQFEKTKAGTGFAAESAAGTENSSLQDGKPAATIAAASETCNAAATASASRQFDFSAAASEPARLDIAAALVEATRAIVVLKGSGTIVAAAGREPLVNTTGNPGMATGGSGDVLAGVITGLAGQKRQLDTEFAASSHEVASTAAAAQASNNNRSQNTKLGTELAAAPTAAGTIGNAAASAADTENSILQDDKSAATTSRIGAYDAAVAGVYIHGLAGDLAAADLGEYGLISGDLPLYVAKAIKKITDK